MNEEKEIRLTPLSLPHIPIEMQGVTPDNFAGKTLEEIKHIKIQRGNTQAELAEFFEVEGEAAQQAKNLHIVLDDGIPSVKYVGHKMIEGKITIKGDAGMHTGSAMSGGQLKVEGNVDSWAGAEMTGGVLLVEGDAGNLLGAGYRGSKLGMNGGVIFVKGDAGVEVGATMRRGVIATLGDIGDLAGTHIIAGTIMSFGKMGSRAGMGMKRGNLITYGGIEGILPSFRYDSVIENPTFLRFYLRKFMEELGMEEAEEFIDASYKRYHGDITSPVGKGELLVYNQK